MSSPRSLPETKLLQPIQYLFRVARVLTTTTVQPTYWPLQVESVKAFGKPAADRSEESSRASFCLP